MHVGKAQAVAGIGEGLHHGGKPGGIDVALGIAFRCEVHQVDDAGKRRVRPYDGADGPCQMLPNVPWPGTPPLIVEGPLVGFSAADDTPTGFWWQMETQ